jgi:hypothetical protein
MAVAVSMVLLGETVKVCESGDETGESSDQTSNFDGEDGFKFVYGHDCSCIFRYTGENCDGRKYNYFKVRTLVSRQTQIIFKLIS